jgi:hypothetical protein
MTAHLPEIIARPRSVTVYVVPFNGCQIKRARTVDLAVDFLRSKQRRSRRHLKIGAETVKQHLKRAMRKLKTRDRAQAIAPAIREGLMS